MDTLSKHRTIEVTHRRMLMLALPMTLSHVTTPLLGLVDATVVGQARRGPPARRGRARGGDLRFRVLELRLAAHGHRRPHRAGDRRGRPPRSRSHACPCAGRRGHHRCAARPAAMAHRRDRLSDRGRVRGRDRGTVDLFLHPHLGRSVHAGELRHPRFDARARPHGSRASASGRHQPRSTSC